MAVMAAGVKHSDNIPVEGFSWYATDVYKDTTKMEREQARLQGTYLGNCKQAYPVTRLGICTRPKGHTGMHLAGNSEIIVAAW